MLKLKNYIKLNPKEHISKGEIVRQVAMADLEPFNRDIKKWSYVKYKSGTKFRNGDILLARITPCLENGKTSFVNSLKQGEVAVGSTEFYVLRAIEGKMDPNYLYYLSISQNFRKNLIKSMTGTSGRQRVTKEALLNYETDIPDIDNQKDIGLKLSLIDDIISINNKINDNLLELAKALFHEKFSYDDEVLLSNYFLPKRGKNLLKRNVVNGYIPVVAGGLTPAAFHNKSNTESPVITISSSGANAGYTQIWGQKVWSSDSSYIDKTVTDNIYFWYLIIKSHQKQIFDSQTGSAQPHIYPQDIGNILIPKINEAVAKKIDKAVTPIFQKIFQNKDENKKLDNIKAVLLDRYFH